MLCRIAQLRLRSDSLAQLANSINHSSRLDTRSFATDQAFALQEGEQDASGWLENLKPQRRDPICEARLRFREDPNPDKVDLTLVSQLLYIIIQRSLKRHHQLRVSYTHNSRVSSQRTALLRADDCTVWCCMQQVCVLLIYGYPLVLFWLSGLGRQCTWLASQQAPLLESEQSTTDLSSTQKTDR